MRRIDDRPLWIGNAGDLRNPAAILDTGVEAVVELADNEPLAALPRELIRVRIPLSDGGDNSPPLLRLAIRSVAGLVRAKIPTLVACSAGMSRSLTVTAASLVLADSCDPGVALEAVTRSGPVDVSPRMWQQIREALIEEMR